MFRIHYSKDGVHVSPDYPSKKGTKNKKLKVTEEELFNFMASGREVRVTCTDGEILEGKCWAYGAAVSAEEFGEDEPTLDVGCSTIIQLSQIEKIEYID